MRKNRAQSSIEFLIVLPVVMLIAIFIAGEFTSLTKSTLALAAAKEIFYEKTADLNTAVQLERVMFAICQGNTLKLNFGTIPKSVQFTAPEKLVLAQDINNLANYVIVDVNVNHFNSNGQLTQPPC